MYSCASVNAVGRRNATQTDLRDSKIMRHAMQGLHIQKDHALLRMRKHAPTFCAFEVA
jgi:hypothetical protein